MAPSTRSDGARAQVPSLFGVKLPSVPELELGGGLLLSCGPERGFTDSESAAMRSARFVPVHLGPQILRTELAAALAATIVAGRCGWLETVRC